jgi:hypothetical protein
MAIYACGRFTMAAVFDEPCLEPAFADHACCPSGGRRPWDCRRSWHGVNLYPRYKFRPNLCQSFFDSHSARSRIACIVHSRLPYRCSAMRLLPLGRRGVLPWVKTSLRSKLMMRGLYLGYKLHLGPC